MSGIKCRFTDSNSFFMVNVWIERGHAIVARKVFDGATLGATTDSISITKLEVSLT